MLKVYLDLCALNRLFDERTQERVRQEAEAVEDFLKTVDEGSTHWIAGEVMRLEANKNPKLSVRYDVLELLSMCSEKASLNQISRERGAVLENVGYGGFDALHMAVAESSGADVLLTTDDRFLRRAMRGLGNPRVRVLNPVNWSKEFER